MMFFAIGTPSELVIQSGSAVSLWNTVASGDSSVSSSSSSGVGTFFNNQGASNLFDGKNSTKFTSRGNGTGNSSIAGLNTGFHVTIALCQPTLVQFRFTTSDLGPERDPIRITVEGTNNGNLMSGASWTLIYNGTSGLENVTTRKTVGQNRTISTPSTFSSYRFLVTSKRDNGSFVSYSEVELFGY
jgi:hypothetical protein